MHEPFGMSHLLSTKNQNSRWVFYIAQTNITIFAFQNILQVKVNSPLNFFMLKAILRLKLPKAKVGLSTRAEVIGFVHMHFLEPPQQADIGPHGTRLWSSRH